MISMSKKYKTRGNQEVKILYTNLKGDFPVVAVIDDKLYFYSRSGTHCYCAKYDLIEPYSDFKIDDKVIAINKHPHVRYKGHFAGVNSEGKPMTFTDGETSWSTNHPPCSWDICVKAE